MGQWGPRHRQRKRSRPCPQLVYGLPWPVDGHISAHQRLGCCGRVSVPTSMGGGRSFPGRRRNLRPPRLSLATAQGSFCKPGRSPQSFTTDASAVFVSYSHRVETCRLPQRCLHCHSFRHLARDYKRPRHAAASAAKGGDRPRHSIHGGKTMGVPARATWRLGHGRAGCRKGHRQHSTMTMVTPEYADRGH